MESVIEEFKHIRRGQSRRRDIFIAIHVQVFARSELEPKRELTRRPPSQGLKSMIRAAVRDILFIPNNKKRLERLKEIEYVVEEIRWLM